MILFLEGSQNGTDTAKSVWPACTASHSPAPVRPCGCRRILALQNEVRAAMPHPEQFVPDTLENITAYLREDLCIGAYDGERLGAYFILRYCGRSAHNVCGLSGGAPGGVGALGQCRQRGGPPGLAGQRSAAEAAGSGAASCPARHRGHRGHRQSGESIQPEQCPCLRFCHCRPP